MQLGGVSLLTWLLVASPLGVAADSAASTPVGLVRAWDAALNAHDPQAAMALMADGADVQADRAPQQPEQVRGWIEQLIRENTQVDLIGMPQIDSSTSDRYGRETTVTWRARLSMDRFRQSGVQFVDATLGAVVVDSRITFLSVRPDAGWFQLLGR
jgi:hypothetical protein